MNGNKKKVTMKMYKMKNNKTDNIEEHFVDLGLPSGLKWAKCNIGAEKETDYGDYFMWGSTTPNTKTECIWKNAPFDNRLSKHDEEYFNANKTEWLNDNYNLKTEYDAAYKATGGMARMPTQYEIQELLDNTDNEWIDDFNGSCVNGRKFTSRIDSSKYIFIPAAGCYSYGSVYGVGGSGRVWSSSLYAPCYGTVWGLNFYLGNCYMGSNYCYDGRSIRPVTD